jgi:hypothetical protein
LWHCGVLVRNLSPTALPSLQTLPPFLSD